MILINGSWYTHGNELFVYCQTFKKREFSNANMNYFNDITSPEFRETIEIFI